MADLDDLFNVFDEKDSESKVGAPNVQVDEAEPGSDVSSSQSAPKSGDSSSKRDHPKDEKPFKSKKQKKSKKSNGTADSSEEGMLAETSAAPAEDEEIKDENVENLLDDVNLDEVIPRITIHTVEALSCTHEVAVPPNMTYVPLKPSTGKPHKEYSFVLDAFQKEAILCIENNQSVLVSAHTSAGKTVCAAYAIAKSLAEKQRVIYTTPIKALSNQKYREFFEEFHDVGLVTGDVTINPTASCLIMTTEILRNMLYRGSEVMREVGWVVFDEIHYMRDKERGVVWEETLILLPNNVHHVFLSATIPNARQFAEWVAHLHQQPCHVVYTDYRPVPLQHYIFPAGGDGIHLVVDENGTFKEDNFNTAMTVLANAGDSAKGDSQRGRKGGMLMTNKGESNIFKIVKMIMERSYAPVIIFSFSKKECEMYAMQMAKLDFNTMEEKKMVNEVFENAMDVLSEEDKRLPQVENVLPLLRRGIGIHHGGLLPILKETIEILFAEGLIKALFATETFAMGLNMPARTVLFTCPRKFDGKDMRWITSGEYIQMSGRAGRRGLDDKGIVILMIDEKVSPAVGREIVKGLPDPINSAFHLTYNMVLNLLRVEEINPEYMLERSFYQFQNMASIPVLVEKVKAAQDAYDAVKVRKESQISTYYRLRQQLQLLSNDFRGYLTQPKYVIPFLQPGRMIKVKHGKDDEFDWGIIVNFKKLQEGPKGKGTSLVVEVLLHISEDSEEPVPCPPGKPGKMEVVPIVQTLILSLSSLRLYIPNDLRPSDNRKSVLKSITEVKQRFPDGPPLLNPVEDMKIKDEPFLEVVKKIEAFEERLFAHPLHDSEELDELYRAYEEKYVLGEQLSQLKKEMKMAKSVLQMDELKCRKRVLRRLGYSTAADVIEMKGRVACELSSIDELLMTEMIFNNLFVNLTVPQCVALLSCFVCDEKSNEQSKMSEELGPPLKQMQELARRIAKVSTEAKLDVNEDEYVERFKPFLMDVVHAWCKGSSFLQLCEMTDIFEGSIIRCMRRLEEVLRQMCQAAKNIGNVDLENKFSEGIKMMKRDIVFAASLYL